MAKVVHLDKQLQNHITYIVNRGTEYEQVYDSLEDFSSNSHKGYYLVGKDGKFGVINSAGGEVIPPKYDRIKPYFELYGNGGVFDQMAYFVVFADGLQGVFDQDGRELCPLKYELVRRVDLRRETAIVGNYYGPDQDLRVGVIRRTDDWGTIIPVDYDTIYETETGYSLQNRHSLWGFADFNGKTLVECRYNYVFDLDNECTLVYRRAPYSKAFIYDVLARDGSVIGQFKNSNVARLYRQGDNFVISTWYDNPDDWLFLIRKTDHGYSLEPYADPQE